MMKKSDLPKSSTLSESLARAKTMGPNPLKLCEELLGVASLRPGMPTCDLGSGTGITSALLVREYGLDVYAIDLWSDPAENRAFFRELGIDDATIRPIKADASQGLPVASEFFECVVSIDSHNYYGRDPRYLDKRLLPYVRRGGMLYPSISGTARDCHGNLPDCLLASWTPEQLEYMHGLAWWRAMTVRSSGARIVDMHEMGCTREARADWLACDNEYAVGDRAAVEAGALELLDTPAIVLRKP